jgi:fumarate reductase subunit D
MSLAAGKSVSRRKSYRGDPLWIAALVHRISGLMLALFLPLHFLALGLAIEGEAQLDGFLRWTDRPLVKLAEAVLVLLIAVHLLGGLRVLAIENFSLRQNHRLMVALVAAAAIVLACCFLIRVF